MPRELSDEAVHGQSADADGVNHGAKKAVAPGFRLVGGGIFLAVLAIVFGRDVQVLVAHSLANDLHSHIVLVPFISAYLIYVYRARLPRDYAISWIWALVSAIAGGAAFVFARRSSIIGSPAAQSDYLALIALSLILFLVAGGFFFLGWRWMAASAFPFAFLGFAIPLPDVIIEVLENGSKMASAEVANILFELTATPMVRDGAVFQLPGIVIEVAQECSGIRSSWVLLITSSLASFMFLSSPWRRTILVLLVIPLGFIRNGFRILVIGLLCVYVNPEMINSIVHRKGGPVFFVLSLIPLFLILWSLRKGDRPSSLPSFDKE